MLKKAEKFYKVIIILVDLALVNLAYILAFLIKFEFSLPQFNFAPYLEAMPFITIAALVYFDMYGLLKFYRKTLYDTVISIVFVVALVSMTTVAITYFNQGFSFPRSVLLIAPLIQFVLLGLWKALIFKIREHISVTKKLMVIGSTEELGSILDKVNFSIRGLNEKIQCVYSFEELGKAVKKAKEVDEVLICPGVPDEKKMELMSYFVGKQKVVYVIPQLFEISLLNSRLVQFDDMPAFMIDRLGLSVEQRFFKRVFDIVISIVGIILTFPIMLTAAAMVKLTSNGKVVYSQERVTCNNRIYDIYKFRTMSEDAEQETGPVLSGKDDPRVTAVGRVLRKFRIDELPQLFNVLKGDMSIVGPRSERPHFVEQYVKDIPEYRHRVEVKAGITGYAQIFGNYDTTPEDKLRYDLLYIKNYSLLLDVKLIFQTLKVVFTGNSSGNKTFAEGLKAVEKQRLTI